MQYIFTFKTELNFVSLYTGSEKIIQISFFFNVSQQKDKQEKERKQNTMT